MGKMMKRAVMPQGDRCIHVQLLPAIYKGGVHVLVMGSDFRWPLYRREITLQCALNVIQKRVQAYTKEALSSIKPLLLNIFSVICVYIFILHLSIF